MTQDSLEEYRLYWHNKFEKKRADMEVQRHYLIELAKSIARFLKDEYNLSEIYLIGSLASNRSLSWQSDIDLVVKGIPDEKYFSILSRIYDLLPKPVKLDLIPFEDTSIDFQQKIAFEGVPL